MTHMRAPPLGSGSHAPTLAPSRRAGVGEAARRTHELETLHRLARRVASEGEPRSLLERALDTLVAMGWFTCGEALLDDGGRLVTVAVGRCDAERCDACPLRAGLEDGAREALRSGAVTHRGPGTWSPSAADALFALAGAEDVSDSFLAAVVELVDAALKRTHLHARLAEKEQQRSRLLQAVLSAQEEERGRISRDLHDQIGQSLTALLLGLDRNLETPDADDLAKLKEIASITLADVRRIALDLRPSVLDELGLEAALRRFARDTHERYGIEVRVLVTLSTRLGHQEETVLYRVAQEALTNVVRHAGARAASVVVTVSHGGVQLVVEDDGVGFDPRALAAAEQVGLMGMRERLELLGGSLGIESAHGEGCSVYARLPSRRA
jgi:signal transduction histidine kinase